MFLPQLLIFILSIFYAHSAHIVYFCYAIFTDQNLILNIFVAEISKILHILEFATLDLDLSAACIKGKKLTATLAIRMFF